VQCLNQLSPHFWSVANLNFPFPHLPTMDKLFTDVPHLLRADGTQATVADVLAGKKWAMLYFGCALLLLRARAPV
jgi:hypothetical protein